MHESAQNNDANMNTTINIATEPTVILTVEPTAPLLVETSPLLITGNNNEGSVGAYGTGTVALTGTGAVAVTAGFPDGVNTDQVSAVSKSLIQADAVLAEEKRHQPKNTARAYDPKSLEFLNYCKSVFEDKIDAEVITADKVFGFIFFQAYRQKKL